MYLLPLVVLTVGIMGAVHMVKTAPKAQQRPARSFAALVQVDQLTRTSERAILQAMGEIIPAKEVILQPRVSGEIVEINRELVPGGCFKAGEMILQIDQSDYKLAVERARSEVAQATYELKMEQGQQEIARHEWDLLNIKDSASDLDRELALRRPHLIKAQASLDAAKAAAKQAELDLERTMIRAPFDCVVVAESVDLGSQVTPQTQLASLIGTEEYWVQASIPVDRLRWIKFPSRREEPGSPAIFSQQVSNHKPVEWSGEVVRLLGDLEQQGRMARVIIAVQDPLGRKPENANRMPLLIGSYGSVEIEGAQLEDVVSLPRSALREGDRVWLMDAESKLEFREVEVAWRNRDTVLVSSGLSVGDRLVVSDLPAPVEGMALTTKGQPAGAATEAIAQRAGGQDAHSE
jgi:RND family efflux transporter MFP subunit